jgi:predicted ATPase
VFVMRADNSVTKQKVTIGSRNGDMVELLGSTPAPMLRPSEVRERKPVFTLEGVICGRASLDRRVGSERAAEIVRDFFRVAQDIAYKHDAHVHQTDEHGFTFVVGLPVAAEDDAARTIRLALALIDALDGIGHDVEPELRLGIGIQRGNAMLWRRDGSRFRYELSASTTTIARRLAAEAPGAGVLVGGGVFRVACDDWNFEELASITIATDPDTQPGAKADADSGVRAKVYALRGPKERAQRMRERAVAADEVLGRELELKALRDAYRDVLVSRHKRHVVILGEAGVGKRSLLIAFLASIPTDEATVIRAAARAATSFTPYAIIADLGRDLLGLAEGAESHEIRRRVEMVTAALVPGHEGSREVRGLMETMGMLMGARFDFGGEAIDPLERKERILQALSLAERHLAPGKPLVVVGEDVHWADEESAELFIELLKMPSERPILGLVTGRPEPRVLESAADTGADIITLEELDPDTRIAMVVRRFAEDEDVDELAQQIVARAGGNPFFIREMINALVERGIVVADPAAGGRLRWVKRDAPIHVPTRVEALVSTRIDRLPWAEKDTLMRVAVLGRQFSAAQVEAILGRSGAVELGELVSRGLICRSGTGFSFRNDMTMTVAYRTLPEEERNRLHREAATRLANQAGYRPGQDDAVIARHLELAGDAGPAASRYAKAAAHAIGIGGNADALRQLQRALRLLPADDREAQYVVYDMQEQVLRNLARRRPRLEALDNLHKAARALGDPGKLAKAQARLAQYYIDIGKAPAALRAIAPALVEARSAGDRLAEAEALGLKATVSRMVGRNEEALTLCDQALELCDDSQDGMLQRASLLNIRGTVLWHTARLHDAIEAYAEALVIYRMLEQRRHEARVLNNMGIVFAELGEIEEALAHYKSSLKLDQELGNRASIPLKLGNIGQTYSDLGDCDRGERYLTKALALVDQSGDKGIATDVIISLGQVHLQRGEIERALDGFERGHRLAIETRDRYQEIRALIYRALAEAELPGGAQSALALAESATSAAHDMPMPVGEIFGLAAQGLALAKLGRGAEAADRAGAAARLQREAGHPEGAEQVLHILAKLADGAGRRADACAAIRDAYDKVQARARSLRDAELRATYLASKLPTAIFTDWRRLGGGA